MFSNWMAYLPELVLIGGAFALLMLGAFSNARSVTLIEKLGVIVFGLAAFAVVYVSRNGELVAFNNNFVLDSFAVFFKFTCFAGAGVALALAPAYFAREGARHFEYTVLMLLCAVGMGVMISARDFI
ncbi:MAG: NADH-quinone oxidoreductase subunit N, partial [Pseudomonadota bacterium]